MTATFLFRRKSSAYIYILYNWPYVCYYIIIGDLTDLLLLLSSMLTCLEADSGNRFSNREVLDTRVIPLSGKEHAISAASSTPTGPI